MLAMASPQLYRSFSAIVPTFETDGEASAIDDLYDKLDETNFSHRVLAERAERLAVLKMTGVRWNDLGEPKCVMASIEMAGSYDCSREPPRIGWPPTATMALGD